jgi:hypothetical protein
MSEQGNSSELPRFARELIGGAEEAGVRMRALGGLGVHFRAGEPHPALRRTYADVDLVARRSDRHEIERHMKERELVPEAEFNAINGQRRQIWWTPDGSTHVDIFLSQFSMCHRVSLEDRLPEGHPSLSAADLLLTKLQVIELNHKDVQDAGALLATHRMGEADEDGTVGITRMTGVLSSDWGFYTTVTDNLERLPALVAETAGELADTVESACRTLREELERAPKSRGFKLRAKVGRRKRWYELPEESIPT